MTAVSLQVTFLGTGTSQGVPVIACQCPVCQSLDFRDKRLRTSIHVRYQNLSLVVDTGPDFRQQMLRESIQSVDAILFTHGHKDHTAGLDDVRAYNFKQGIDMPIYGDLRTHAQLRNEFHYAFDENQYPGIPRLKLIEIDERPFQIGAATITTLPVMHLNLPVLGFRFGNFSYITDANHIPDSTLEQLAGTEILVLNALQKESHVSHFTLAEAIAMAGKIGARTTYFTHMSHRMGLHQEVEKELPEGMHLAYDGLTITL